MSEPRRESSRPSHGGRAQRSPVRPAHCPVPAMTARLRSLAFLASGALLGGADVAVAGFAGAKAAGVQVAYTDTIYLDFAAYHVDNHPATGFAKRFTVGIGSPLLSIGFIKRFEKDRYGKTAQHNNGIKLSGHLPINDHFRVGCYLLTTHVDYSQKTEAGFLVSYHFQ